mmetsp:Transcript_476/g.561  ORF Transcript_476/g.561 Transcript_476/m.561 type:complete len:381 (+) Transcript_476:2540-3682(+)
MLESDDNSINEDDTLLQENSAIFSLLPLLIQGLFHWESHLAILLKFLQNQIEESEVLDESQTIQLQAIYSQIQEISKREVTKHSNQNDVLVIDEDKSLLLTFTFGRAFMDALSILSDSNNINIIVYCEEGTDKDLVNELGVNYLQGNFESTGPGAFYPISVKVTQVKQVREQTKLRVSKKRMAEIGQRLAYLDLERMLNNAGLTINDAGELTTIPKSTNTLKESDSQNLFLRSSANSDERIQLQKELNEAVATKRELNIVDLKSWYCSCEEFQASYVSSQDQSYQLENWRDFDHTTTTDDTFPTLSPLRMIDADNLIAKFYDNQITRYFRSLLPQNQTKHLSTLPICCHILALSIAASNSPYTHRYFTVSSLDNLWSMLT